MYGATAPEEFLFKKCSTASAVSHPPGSLCLLFAYMRTYTDTKFAREACEESGHWETALEVFNFSPFPSTVISTNAGIAAGGRGVIPSRWHVCRPLETSPFVFFDQ